MCSSADPVEAGAPSASGPTRTSEHGAGAARKPRPESVVVAAPGPRDPERYVIVGEHGRGGLGRVSRAHDRELGRDIAIKELISRGDAGEVRFLREALITARLEHPGIVPLYEAGRWPDGTPFYAMKLVAGRSLRELIAERTTVEDRIGLLHHVIAVADAIAYAHGRNIIHRDLKPANVIVGDFGETIVIDWGLAKDLTLADEVSSVSGSLPELRDDGLTTTGSVLGTPAYMAPEQRRGEHVDQRVDVFAIGAMLWELCAIQKAPPTEPYIRRRMLRRTGIDKDLATIIDKALDPDRERRYPDASALAADLKAFKSGARIAARHYSTLAMVTHWTRRHRTLAVSSAAVLALAIAGVALYVRDVALERDRADSSEADAKRARASAETSLDELTLKHAQLLLTTDPSAAMDALATYRGSDVNRASQIRAEATGRGVAVLRAVPHTDLVRWAETTPDGAIVSLSSDGTIARTALDGTSTTVSRSVARNGQASYSAARKLLAFACDPSDVCIYDVLHGAQVPVAAILRRARPAGISFSPDGRLLAVMSQDAVLSILDVGDPSRPLLRLARPIKAGNDVKFLDDDTVAAGTLSGLEFVHMDGRSESFSVPDNTYWDARASDHLFTSATPRGDAFVFEGFPLRVAAHAQLCHGLITGLRFVPGRRGVAYVCREGTVGIWDLPSGKTAPRLHLEGHGDLITVSPAGDYIIAAGDNGTVTVLDLVTDLVTSYKGHEFRLTALTPPSDEHPFVISADVRGALRAWRLPLRLARVVTTASSKFNTAILDDRSTMVTATTFLPVLTTYSPAAGVGSVGPHELWNIYLEQGPGGSWFATYGLNDVIEIWSSATMTRSHLINTGHGSISQLHFVGDTGDVVTSGRDGRLVRWDSSEQATVIARLDQPIEGFALAPATGSIVFSSADGALWHTDADGRPVLELPGGSRVLRLITLPDQRTVYAGYANGTVVAIDTRSWQHEIVLRGSGSVQDISITSDGHTMAISTNDGTLHVSTAQVGARTWRNLKVRARHQALAPDGVLVTLGTDGTIWMYSIPRRRWLCVPTGTGDLRRVAMTTGGGAAVALDAEGRLIWIDLDAARKLLDGTP
jgi:serine/threonine protein kinase/WD40 repeat protein